MKRATRFHLLALLLLCPGALLSQPLPERIAANEPVHHWQFPHAELKAVGEVREMAGPSSDLYPTFPEGWRAVGFERGSYLRHLESGTKADYKFDNGQTITLECWVQCSRIPNGHNQYIIGKGRTQRDGFAPENQNWALRLRAQKHQARLSFLFRSRDEAGQPGEYHRWTTNTGFAPGPRWHHLAVTYTFGKPESIRAWIDGASTDGSWDLGGATARPPVVDDDEIWIGSALGGTPAATLDGAIASIALYRRAVDGFEEAFEAQPPPLRPFATQAPPGRIALEIFQSDSGAKDWPEHLDEPLRTLDTERFALFHLPPTYGSSGERMEQSGVYYLRFHGSVNLPAGEHELLIRSPGLTRLQIGDAVVAEKEPGRIIRDAHGPLRPRPALPYPRPRLGTSDLIVTYHSDGGKQDILLEALAGDPGGKIQVGEILVAINHDGPEEWNLLGTGETDIPFTPREAQAYRNRQQDHFAHLNTTLRRERSASTAPHWAERHDRARKYIEALPPISTPAVSTPAPTAIDAFLNARIESARELTSESDPHFEERIHPLLEQHCFRCHGKKAKGGLRLDSREAILKGGESGPAIVPGKADESELLTRVHSADEDLQMPPKGERLPEEDLAALRTWIEQGAPWTEPAPKVEVPAELDELAFLRRLYLDTVGVFPSPSEIESYLNSEDPDKRETLIDRLLADPRHADHWVSYWQDVLAENPRLVKPSLNNTGPFRWWIHEALLDQKPFDQFVTELITFSGGTYSGGAGGFKLATQNDVPMAAKAHVLGTAFLGVEMKCARCHDAPFHSLKQGDLFSMAAMLKGAPLKVPESSSVPPEFFERGDGRPARIKVSLDPKSSVAPAWPFPDLAPPASDLDMPSPAHQLAHQITRPENRRFAQVIVNRVWKRYFGEGFVEPVHDWEGSAPSHPELLDDLARQFVAHKYDLRHLSRLILNSEAYRRAPRNSAARSSGSRFFEAPLRRRLTAEQLVDSLFTATGTPLFAEELTLDVSGWYPNRTFLNMGVPRRAWELISLSTERDRPSLTLPLAQAVVSFMEAYGWRSNRAEPLTDRTADADVLQAGMVANSLLATWWTRLSDYSDLTALAVRAETVEELVDQLFLQLLTRRPTQDERRELITLLEPGFESRLTAVTPRFRKRVFVPNVRDVTWNNHLNAEANQLAAALEVDALEGPQPTQLLTPGWRVLFEDAVWALINSPEMQFSP